MDLSEGTILVGRDYTYKIINTLGQGSFGITYLAEAKSTDATEGVDISYYVAIKEFFMREINGRSDNSVTVGNKAGLFDKYKQKFVSEAKSLSNLRHPNIVKVIEWFETNNTVYYAMQHIDGGSLEAEIERRGKLPENESLDIVEKIAAALKFLHSKNRLHLDVKPSNVMIGEDKQVYLIDFGLSKQYDDNGNPESSTNVGGGTNGYAPVEQMNYMGDSSRGFPVTMDIYALGGTLFKMVTGHRPPDASDILNKGFPKNLFTSVGVSTPMVSLIEKLMTPLVKDRPQSMEEVEVLLRETRNGMKRSTQKKSDSAAKPKTGAPGGTVKKPTKQKVSVTVKKQKAGTSASRWLNEHVHIFTVLSIAIVVGVGSMLVYRNYSSHEIEKSMTKGSANGHGWVDLGLPSGTKWATCNVGASFPQNSGDFFAWGECNTKSNYVEEGSKTAKKTLSQLKGSGITRSGNSLAADYDAATARWGNAWRMPKRAEVDELIRMCKWEWTGKWMHKGYKITGPNGNSIFLPVTGYKYGDITKNEGKTGNYWTSTASNDNDNAGRLYFDSNGTSRTDNGFRYAGRAVRPVLAY